jgi:lipoprotein signal peptidase
MPLATDDGLRTTTHMNRSFRGLLWTLALVGGLLDLGSKYAVFRWLYHPSGEGSFEVVPGAFRLLAQFTDVPPSDDWRGPLQALNGPVRPRVNHGALFGLGTEYQIYANSFFAVVSVAAACAIGYWSTRPATARDGPLCAALGLILGGTAGNLFDRIVFNGVRDWMHFYWFEWPVFNFADCCLVCGAGLLLLQAFWAPAHRPKTPEAAPATAGEPQLAEVK